ncbi:MAG: TetR/AcrR family transcriptional regulator [Bacteroidota bacterium]
MKGELTKEKIIERSAELFNIYGYHGCSLSDIMKATKLKKGGIYNHFKNKDEIALEAFDYSYQAVIKRFRSRLDHDKTVTEKLNSIIEVFASFAPEPVVKGGCPIFNTAVDSSNSHPALREKAKQGINNLRKYIEIKIEEGKANGEVRQDVVANELSTLLIITLEGAIIMSRVNGNNIHADIAVKHLKGYLEEKVLA